MGIIRFPIDDQDRKGGERSITGPTLHLNGSSAETLSEGFHAAHDAVSAAIEALCAAAPNARDYYVQDQAFTRANAEHVLRLRKLSEVQAELAALCNDISNQIYARSAGRKGTP